MTSTEKLELDLRDFWRIHDGVLAYAGLEAKAMVERARAHPEDAFCRVTNFAGDGELMCTRDAHDAVIDLAERHRDSLAVPDDYSVKEIADIIRQQIVRVMVDEKQDEPALARVLAVAVAEANKNHIQRTYHFPCVITRSDKPPQFCIGPVAFNTVAAFPNFIAKETQAYVDRSTDMERSAKRVEDFHKYCKDYGWVATVTVPPCSEESSKRRAEVAVSVAINLLRLVFGIPYGRTMRLAHVVPTHPRHSEYAIQNGSDLSFVWSGKGIDGALVEDDWHLAMDKWKDYWNFGAHLVSTALNGKRSEIADRLIDALTWFGEAAFESAPGTQIVNFVAALERLTTTDNFRLPAFCSRVTLLAYEKEADFEKTYWDAHAIYTARSGVMHGGFSPTNPTFLKTLRLAHDVKRNALFRGLEVHCVLDGGGKQSGLADLRNFFNKHQSKWATTLKKLGDQLKARKVAAGSP